MPNPSGPAEQVGNPANAANPAPHKGGFTLSDLFLGRDGLRALWAILLFLLFREILVDSLTLLLSMLLPYGAEAILRPGRLLSYEGIALVSVAIPTWTMAKIERRPTSAYGLGGQRRLRNFFAGLAWGIALLSLLVFTLRASGLLVFDERLLFGTSGLRFGTVWLADFLLVGLFEEYFFRGYLQFTLARGINGLYRWLRATLSSRTATRTTEWSCTTSSNPASDTTARPSGQNALGFWIAAVLLSFGFGFIHRTNSGESPIGLVAATLIAVVFCLSLWRTGSLWWAIGFHAAWDWAQSFLYGVSDSGLVIQGHLCATHPTGRAILSGGLTGPEGSLFILPIVALTAAVIVITLPRVHRGNSSASTRNSTAGLDSL
jgi:hypothetical protein